MEFANPVKVSKLIAPAVVPGPLDPWMIPDLIGERNLVQEKELILTAPKGHILTKMPPV